MCNNIATLLSLLSTFMITVRFSNIVSRLVQAIKRHANEVKYQRRVLNCIKDLYACVQSLLLGLSCQQYAQM